MAEQSREEESEINSPRNILAQDAGWRTGKLNDKNNDQ
jgi:hypothetical protein